MTSTEMMNDKRKEGESMILMSLTKSMKISSNLDGLEEIVARPMIHSIDSIKYMMPSYKEEEIMQLMSNNFSLNCRNSQNKRPYIAALNNQIKVNDTYHNNNNIVFGNVKKSKHIETIINELKEIQTKEALREYCSFKIIHKIQNQREEEANAKRLKEQVDVLNLQIKEKKEEAKKLSITLKETNLSLQREIERQSIQKIMIRRLAHMKQNILNSNKASINH